MKKTVAAICIVFASMSACADAGLDDARARVKSILMNTGYVCSKVTNVSFSGTPDVYKVTCIMYLGDGTEKVFLVNTRTHTVTRL
jgi:hypothetical protein